MQPECKDRIVGTVAPGVMPAETGIVQSDRSGQLQNRSPLIWTIVGTTLGLILLYASTRKVNLSALSGILRDVNWTYVGGILAATVTFIAMKAWRWGLLLRFVPGLKFRELHSAVYVGLAVNFLVVHVGEILRTAFVARRNRVAISAVLVSVFIERAMDFIALLALLTLVLIFGPQLPELVVAAGVVSCGVVVVAFAGLYLLLHPPGWLERAAESISHLLPHVVAGWLNEQLQRSRLGLAALNDTRVMAIAVAASIMQWSLVVAAIWCSGLAIGQPVSIVGATVTFVLIVVGLALPNSPMQIGTTQLAFVIGLGTDGTDATLAIAASLVYTLFLIVPIMIIGGLIVIRNRLISDLKLR